MRDEVRDSEGGGEKKKSSRSPNQNQRSKRKSPLSWVPPFPPPCGGYQESLTGPPGYRWVPLIFHQYRQCRPLLPSFLLSFPHDAFPGSLCFYLALFALRSCPSEISSLHPTPVMGRPCWENGRGRFLWEGAGQCKRATQNVNRGKIRAIHTFIFIFFPYQQHGAVRP